MNRRINLIAHLMSTENHLGTRFFSQRNYAQSQTVKHCGIVLLDRRDEHVFVIILIIRVSAAFGQNVTETLLKKNNYVNIPFPLESSSDLIVKLNCIF